MTSLAERRFGDISVQVPKPDVYSPSPLEKVFKRAVAKIHDIFERGLPTKLWLYEVPLELLPRQDIVRTAVHALASEWGQSDKQYNGQTGFLYRDGVHGELIARVNVPDAKILIPLRDGEERTIGKVRTIMGPLTSHVAAIEVAEEAENYLSARKAEQVRKRDHQIALEASRLGFRPGAIATFIVP